MGKKTGSGGEKSRGNWQVNIQFCFGCGRTINEGEYCEDCLERMRKE